MERLTKRNEKGLAVLAFKCPDECEHSTCSIEEGYQCQHQCEGDIIEKLATYEEFEEIFREKMASVACEFLSDKEEFGKWLDRNKWITKKCDEYARAEEQGLLLRLPCKDKLINVLAEKVLNSDFGSCYMCTNPNKYITLDGVNNGCDGNCGHKEFKTDDLIKKIVEEIQFKAEAEQSLKELENIP